ncbi:transcription factor [Salix suchowensis]|nr:transcription factor [Salix suchowensis]
MSLRRRPFRLPPPSNSLLEPSIIEALDKNIRSIPIVSKHCSLEDFDLFWDQGIPFLVRDHTPKLRCDWSPVGLADVLGADRCTVVDCEDTDYLKTTTVEDFLLGLDEKNDRVLKLKDYPTDQRFKSKSYILARDFQLALPAPAYSSEDGPLNITNFFPINYSNIPDLGPKMYAAMTSKFGHDGHGSTRLHIDISDAVNIMARGEALWHVFLSKDADQLKKYVATKYKGPWLNDNPFLNQYHKYLTSTDLAELKELGITPFTFRQRQGDVVFIPAGSPHQLSKSLLASPNTPSGPLLDVPTESPAPSQKATSAESSISEPLTDDHIVGLQTSTTNSQHRDDSPSSTDIMSLKIDLAVQQALEKAGLHQHPVRVLRTLKVPTLLPTVPLRSALSPLYSIPDTSTLRSKPCKFFLAILSIRTADNILARASIYASDLLGQIMPPRFHFNLHLKHKY